MLLIKKLVDQMKTYVDIRLQDKKRLNTCILQLHRITDKNIFDNSYKLVKHFPDFPLWEYPIASFNQKFLIEGSNSLLPEREIREMFY